MNEPDWAEARAREWLQSTGLVLERSRGLASLAALLRDERKLLLAEVRRVVETHTWPQACRDEILRRLKSL